MKRWYTILGCLLVLSSTAWGQSATGVDIGRGPMYNPQFWMWQSPDNKGIGLQWMEQVEELLGSNVGIGTGNIFYVDSNVANEGDGSNWENAKNTLDEAVALCTANNGDIIYVAQGHNESLTAADGVDLDVAGITVIGCGNGSDRPRFDYDNANGEFVIGAAGIRITGLTFLPSVTAITHAIDVEIAGDWAIIENCEFLEGEASGTDEFVDCIQVGTTATNCTIRYNVYTSIGGTGPNNFVDLSAATISNPRVYGNVIAGQFAEAGIWAANAVPTDCFIVGNTVTNLTASQFCIEFQGAASGICVGNICHAATEDYEVDPGSMFFRDNDEGANMPEGTSLYDLVGTLKDAAAGTGAYPTGVTNDSILAMILSKSATAAASDYSNTTDSLQAIADHVQTLITTAAGTGVYPTGVTDDSIIAMLMSKSATTSASSYNNTTDSMEALADHVQTLITTAAGTDVYPSGVTNDSILAMILSKSGTAAASSYNNTTDSLEALGDQALKIDAASLAVSPTAGSIARFIASGGTALGTQLADSKSIVDAIGTNGTTVADTATGIAGMIGINDADNAMSTSSVVSNPDGSMYERQEYTQKIQEIQLATGLHVVQGTGMSLAVWYVNGGVVSGDGKSPTTAFGTLEEAIVAADNAVDDWILVMDYSGGGGTISLDDAFCHIIGMGNGKSMPYPRFMPASAVPAFEFKNASDRVELANLVIGGGDATVPAITADADASAGAYGCYIHDCVIGRDATSAPANDGILIDTGADMPYLVIENCTFYGTWAGLVGCDQSGIQISGNCTGGSILNNFFQGIGSSTNPAINLAGTVGGMRIQGNRIAGADDASAGWAITLSANCTDIFCDDNHAASSDAAGDTSAFVDSAADEANAWGANFTDITLDLP